MERPYQFPPGLFDATRDRRVTALDVVVLWLILSGLNLDEITCREKIAYNTAVRSLNRLYAVGFLLDEMFDAEESDD